jgi:hypothetical protein
MTASSAFWRDLADQFLALQDRLRAGGTHDFYQALEPLIIRGASKLAEQGASKIAERGFLGIWHEELRKENLDLRSPDLSDEVLSAAEDIKMRTIDGICQASLTFCQKREAEALREEFEEQRRSASRHQHQPIEKSDPAATRSKMRASKGRPPSPTVATRREILGRLAATGVIGERYCKAVAEKVSTRVDWQKRYGCPKSYLEAWNHPDPQKRKKYRQLISDEKYKATTALARKDSTR